MSRFLKYGLLAGLVQALAACALFPSWHWARPGATQADYVFDETQCKAQTYSGTDGMVTNVSVRRMHACMQARGWHKEPD